MPKTQRTVNASKSGPLRRIVIAGAAFTLDVRNCYFARLPAGSKVTSTVLPSLCVVSLWAPLAGLVELESQAHSPARTVAICGASFKSKKLTVPQVTRHRDKDTTNV